MLDVASWFLAGGGFGLPGLPVCRVKNKFALSKEDVVGGYRDLMICVVMEGLDELRIIGEIQVNDLPSMSLLTMLAINYKLCIVARVQINTFPLCMWRDGCQHCIPPALSIL